MQDKKVDENFEIPAEYMITAGFDGCVLRVTAKKGKIVIRKATKRDFKHRECDLDCENCPWSRMC